MTEMRPGITLPEAFNDCVNRLQTGQSLDDCLNAYPELANELRPMLEVIRLTRLAMPSTRELATVRHRGANRLRRTLAHNPHYQRRRNPIIWLAQIAAALLLVIVFGGGGTWMAAQRSLPGERLYGLKQLTEDIRLGLSSDDTALIEQFNQHRIDEIQELTQQRQTAEVEFTGTWEVQTESNWIVSGILFEITGDTQIEAGVSLQDQLVVRVRTTSDGRVIALLIKRVEPSNNDGQAVEQVRPTATSTKTSIPSATATPTYTASPEPSPTASSTATTTPTASPIPTRTASPIVTRTRPPTRTPIPTVISCTPMRPNDWEDYRIQTGDTLSQIALRTGTTTDRLIRVNCLTDANILVIGARLFIPDIEADGGDERPSVATEAVRDNGERDVDDSGNDDRHDDEPPEPDDDSHDGDTPRDGDDDRSGSDRGSG